MQPEIFQLPKRVYPGPSSHLDLHEPRLWEAAIARPGDCRMPSVSNGVVLKRGILHSYSDFGQSGSRTVGVDARFVVAVSR